MKVEIGKYFIESVVGGFCIYEMGVIAKGDRKGESIKLNSRWYGRLDMALSRVLRLKLSDSDSRSVQDLIENLARIDEEIKERV